MILFVAIHQGAQAHLIQQGIFPFLIHWPHHSPKCSEPQPSECPVPVIVPLHLFHPRTPSENKGTIH